MSSPGLKRVLGLSDKSQVSTLSTLTISAGYTLSKGIMITVDTIRAEISRLLIIKLFMLVVKVFDRGVEVKPGLQARFNFSCKNPRTFYGVLSIYPVSTTGLMLLPKYAMPPQLI